MIVTLLTDFGARDHYVGVMKGVILANAPAASLVDLSHEVEPGSVDQAAFTLLAAYPYFPEDTVHIVVVDPGVGSERRALVVEAAGQRFVGPDNGVFSFLLEREPRAVVREVTDLSHARTPMSDTFHGRDLFAPVGAALAAGLDAAVLGPIVDDPVRLATLAPTRDPEGLARGRILHIDHYGNGVTSLTRGDLRNGEAPCLRAGEAIVRGVRRQYAGVSSGAPFLVEGSSGFLEISVNAGSAAAALGFRAGDPVIEIAPDGADPKRPAGDQWPAAGEGRGEGDPLALPVRCAVAAVVRRGEGSAEFLAVRRPPDDDRLPDVWGLPAVSLGPGELPEEALRRLGREKLAAELEPVRFVGIRAADRGDYLLILMDIEARLIDGEPDVRRANTRRTAYVEQRWTDDLPLLADAARRGSVCSRILLEASGASALFTANGSEE